MILCMNGFSDSPPYLQELPQKFLLFQVVKVVDKISQGGEAETVSRVQENWCSIL